MGSGKKDGKRPAKDDAERDRRRDGKGDGKRARLAEAREGWDELDARTRRAEAHLRALQHQLDDVLAALDDSTARLREAVRAIDDLPTSATANEAALELRRRLEQMLVAQQRTNELLDLALGVALESGDTPQQLRWRPARS